MHTVKRIMFTFNALFLILISSISVADYEDIVRAHSPTVLNGLLFVSTIDGYLKAINLIDGKIKWSLKEDPILISPKAILDNFTFLPDPQDGGLYVLKHGQLMKLPYSIPQLVSASPCRTSDGVFYAGSKKDVWLEIDAVKGLKVGELSLYHTDRQCPLNKNTSVFIGRSEYKLTMVDPKNRNRRWNATFTDYSSHLLPADPSYPYQHFTSTSGGRVLAVNGAEGNLAWDVDVGSLVVAMYLLQKDGLHKLPYTVIGRETLEEFIKDTGQIGVKTLINDVYRSQSAESTPRHLFPTLYVGESIFGLFAMPAFVDSRTVTVIPNYIGPPLLEGPSVAAVNRGLEPAIISSARSGALIDLHLGERNQEVVNREFLALGYHEPPQLARSEFVVPHKFDHHKRYRSLSFVTADIQSHEFTVETSKINYYKEPGSYSLWKTNKVEIIIAALSTVIIFSVSCWFCMQKLRNHRKGKLLAQRASYAQTSKSHSSIWYARQNQELADGWLQAGKITYNPYDRLGYGCEGTVVFRGKFDGREVAVKRVIADIQLADREVDLLRESDVHPNVIRYFCMECDSNFRYIALELCDYSLYDYVDSAEIRKCCPLSAMEILLQATEGLAYLHTINIVHRDMKPQNVLISKSTMQNTIRALISDFGLCKRLKAGRNSLSRRSGVMGTDGWVAPEALMSDTSITCAVDVFSLGCIYYYVLANGTHPFGDPLKRQANIIQGDYNLDSLDVNSSVNLLAIELIELMIRADPLLRPTSAALVVHPFFWSRGRQLQFFMDVSDRIEKLGDNDILLRRLEKNARSVIGVNWRHNICATLSLDLRKFRTYKGDKVRDLLRAMRNKKHHYRELSVELQEVLGRVPDQFVSYFTEKFPRLLQHTYTAMIYCATEPAFSEYYSEESQKLAKSLVQKLEKEEKENRKAAVQVICKEAENEVSKVGDNKEASESESHQASIVEREIEIASNIGEADDAEGVVGKNPEFVTTTIAHVEFGKIRWNRKSKNRRKRSKPV